MSPVLAMLGGGLGAAPKAGNTPDVSPADPGAFAAGLSLAERPTADLAARDPGASAPAEPTPEDAALAAPALDEATAEAAPPGAHATEAEDLGALALDEPPPGFLAAVATPLSAPEARPLGMAAALPPLGGSQSAQLGPPQAADLTILAQQAGSPAPRPPTDRLVARDEPPPLDALTGPATLTVLDIAVTETAPGAYVQLTDAAADPAPLDVPDTDVHLSVDPPLPAGRTVRVEVDSDLAVEVRGADDGVEVTLEGTAKALEPLVDVESELARDLRDAGSDLAHLDRRERRSSSPPFRTPYDRGSRGDRPAAAAGDAALPGSGGSLINVVA